MLICYLAGEVSLSTPSQFQNMMTPKVNENEEIYTERAKNHNAVATATHLLFGCLMDEIQTLTDKAPEL